MTAGQRLPSCPTAHPLRGRSFETDLSASAFIPLPQQRPTASAPGPDVSTPRRKQLHGPIRITPRVGTVSKPVPVGSAQSGTPHACCRRPCIVTPRLPVGILSDPPDPSLRLFPMPDSPPAVPVQALRPPAVSAFRPDLGCARIRPVRPANRSVNLGTALMMTPCRTAVNRKKGFPVRFPQDLFALFSITWSHTRWKLCA